VLRDVTLRYWRGQAGHRPAAWRRRAMSMTGARTLAAELGLLSHGTQPKKMADEALAPVMAAVPEALRRRSSTCCS
jgi:hypothetical protein